MFIKITTRRRYIQQTLKIIFMPFQTMHQSSVHRQKLYSCCPLYFYGNNLQSSNRTFAYRTFSRQSTGLMYRCISCNLPYECGIHWNKYRMEILLGSCRTKHFQLDIVVINHILQQVFELHFRCAGILSEDKRDIGCLLTAILQRNYFANRFTDGNTFQ